MSLSLATRGYLGGPLGIATRGYEFFIAADVAVVSPPVPYEPSGLAGYVRPRSTVRVSATVVGEIRIRATPMMTISITATVEEAA